MPDPVPMVPGGAEASVYRWALKVTAVTGAAFTVAAASVGWFIAGEGGAWGGLVGALLAVGSGLATQAAMVSAQRRSPEMFAAIVGGTWLGKMVVLVLGLAALTSVEALHRPTLGVAALVGVAGTLVIDLVAVKRGRVPYVGGV